MFGVSFSEVLVIALVAMLAVGPQKLPKALHTLGIWVGKLRRISSEVRYQMGLDDMLRKEGLTGGINELRGLMRGGLAGVISQPALSSSAPRASTPVQAQDARDVADDRSREYPVEGADAYGAIPDDLLPENAPPAPPATAAVPVAPAAETAPVSPAPVNPAPVTSVAAPVVEGSAAILKAESAPSVPPAAAPPRPTPPPPPSSKASA